MTTREFETKYENVIISYDVEKKERTLGILCQMSEIMPLFLYEDKGEISASTYPLKKHNVRPVTRPTVSLEEMIRDFLSLPAHILDKKREFELTFGQGVLLKNLKAEEYAGISTYVKANLGTIGIEDYTFDEHSSISFEMKNYLFSIPGFKQAKKPRIVNKNAFIMEINDAVNKELFIRSLRREYGQGKDHDTNEVAFTEKYEINGMKVEKKEFSWMDPSKDGYMSESEEMIYITKKDSPIVLMMVSANGFEINFKTESMRIERRVWFEYEGQVFNLEGGLEYAISSDESRVLRMKGNKVVGKYDRSFC